MLTIIRKQNSEYDFFGSQLDKIFGVWTGTGYEILYGNNNSAIFFYEMQHSHSNRENRLLNRTERPPHGKNTMNI